MHLACVLKRVLKRVYDRQLAPCVLRRLLTGTQYCDRKATMLDDVQWFLIAYHTQIKVLAFTFKQLGPVYLSASDLVMNLSGHFRCPPDRLMGQRFLQCGSQTVGCAPLGVLISFCSDCFFNFLKNRSFKAGIWCLLTLLCCF